MRKKQNGGWKLSDWPTDIIFLFIIQVVFFYDPSPILFYFYFFIRSELVRVDPSWSDPDWRSELIRFDFCTCLSQNETNKRRRWGMRRTLRRTFFRPERPTLTSCSLQSITLPFQKHFHEVFGNAQILIFYLSIKAWEEKSLPKSDLGWFFLVAGEGKATKENMSIFWFIWPLRRLWTFLFNEYFHWFFFLKFF